MAAHRTLSWLESEKAANKNHLPKSTSIGSKHSAHTLPIDSIELIPASISIPTDSDVGQQTHLFNTLSTVLEQPSQPPPSEVKPCRPRVRNIVKRSASSELLKIEDLNSYMGLFGV